MLILGVNRVQIKAIRVKDRAPTCPRRWTRAWTHACHLTPCQLNIPTQTSRETREREREECRKEMWSTRSDAAGGGESSKRPTAGANGRKLPFTPTTMAVGCWPLNRRHRRALCFLSQFKARLRSSRKQMID